jgi:hypothetical protein
MVTAAILIALWSASSGPPPRDFVIPTSPAVSALPSKPEAPSPLGPTRRIAGRIVGPEGAPVAGAWIFVAHGLESFKFPSSLSKVEIINHGTRFEPSPIVVARGDRVSVRSADHRLHTLKAIWANGHWLRNVPVLGSGAPALLEIAPGGEVLQLQCAVHIDEPASTLHVVHAPFIARSEGDGDFAIEGLPARPVTLRALLFTKGALLSADAQVGDAEETSLRLRF